MYYGRHGLSYNSVAMHNLIAQAMTAQPPVDIGSAGEEPTADRLVFTLFVAVLLHAIVILQVSFNPFETSAENNPPETLDITIVNPTRELPPDRYDYLANSSQDGAGNTDEKVKFQEESVAQSLPPSAPTESPAQQTQVITALDSARNTPDKTETRPLAEEHPSATELVERSMEMIALNQEINQSLQVYSDAPKQKYISARTREFKYANYMRDWVAKVERIGQLNYPDEARRRRLSGQLMVDVAINPDGTVQEITVVRPSGQKILDDAAVRIVRLASPFAPFPDDIRQEIDVLHVTRTWVFTSSNELHSH